MNIDTLYEWSRQHSATGLSAVQQLTTYLALYRTNDDKLLHSSPFQPYLDVLPADFDFHPLTWVINHDSDRFPAISGLPRAIRNQLFRLRKRFDEDKKKIHGIFVRAML
jgi:hypothetical protein